MTSPILRIDFSRAHLSENTSSVSERAVLVKAFLEHFDGLSTPKIADMRSSLETLLFVAMQVERTLCADRARRFLSSLDYQGLSGRVETEILKGEM